MSRRRGSEVKQIQAAWWDSHEVVIIRTRLRHADQKIIYANLASARMTEGSDMQMQFQIAEVQGAMCKAMIQDWTLTDENGKRLKLNPENIDDLAQEDIEFIANEIGALNPVMTPEERKHFLSKQEPSTNGAKPKISA